MLRNTRRRRFQLEHLEIRALLAVFPNDPGFSSQWGLHNSGNFDIDAPEAWGITTGSSSVIVAEIDHSGVAMSHVDLDSKMTSTSWSFADNSSNQNVSTGHGTNIAGIIGAETNNSQGMAGVSWGSPVMALKVNGYDQTVAAIRYAVDNGAKVISISLAYGSYTSTLTSAIDYAASNNVVVVAAAGNGGNTTPTYPAALNKPNLISVAAVNSAGGLASFSTYSPSNVHVGAPGVDVYTTEWTGGYINFAAGTSFAAPYVAGVVALVASKYPSYTATQLVQAVTQNTKPLASLAGKTTSGGMVSAYNALLAGMPAPTASASPANVVNATTTTLSANTSYGGGEPGLTYTWSVLAQPSGVAAPTFSANGTNAAKNSVATFSGSGSYTFQVTVANGSGFVRTATVPVNVSATSTGNLPSPPAFLDDGQTAAQGVTKTAGWTTWTAGGNGGTHSTAATGDGSTKMTYTFGNLPQGVYEVWVNWTQAPNRATNSPFTVFNGATQLSTVRLDQTKAPVGYYDASSSWNTLGQRFTIDSGTLKVVLSNDATPGAFVVGDAVRIRKVGPFTADDSQTVAEGFTKTGSWSPWTGGGLANTHSTAPGGGSSTTATATWTFSNLAPGKYQVWTTWVQAPNRATNSPFSIFDGSTLRHSVAVDQTLAPSGVYTGGFSWKSLAENVTVENGTLVVKLTNNGVVSSRAVVADGVRIQRVGSDYADDTDGSPIYQKTTGWTQWTTSGYSGTHATAPAGDGSINATWTFDNLIPGVYEVWTHWIQAPNRATNSPFTVYDGGTALATVPVNQQLAPTGYFEGGYSYLSLGQSFLVTSGTLKVKLTNAGVAAGYYVVADVVRINRLNNPPGGVVVPFSATPVGPLAMRAESAGPSEAAIAEASAQASPRPLVVAAPTRQGRSRMGVIESPSPFRARYSVNQLMRKALVFGSATSEG